MNEGILNRCRDQFESLQLMQKNNEIFVDNAGGSQCPAVVVEAIATFLTHHNVQKGAVYPRSQYVVELCTAANKFMNCFFNTTEDTGQIMFGLNSTQLLQLVATSYADYYLQPGDEVVVQISSHAANLDPWLHLAHTTGVKIQYWHFEANIDQYECRFNFDTLESLLTSRTKLVAVTHVNNLMGDILDLKRMCQMVRKKSDAHIVVDGVAFAPHRSIDVSDYDCDWYVFSNYKVFGPHCATLYGKKSAINQLAIPDDKKKAHWNQGCKSFESLAGILGLKKYFNILLDLPLETPVDRNAIEKVYHKITLMESKPQQILLEYLLSKPGVGVVGPRCCDIKKRVSTISFYHQTVNPRTIVAALHSEKIWCRNGHMQSSKFVEVLSDLDNTQGIVRISLVHYNTEDEVQRVISCLERHLPNNI